MHGFKSFLLVPPHGCPAAALHYPDVVPSVALLYHHMLKGKYLDSGYRGLARPDYHNVRIEWIVIVDVMQLRAHRHKSEHCVDLHRAEIVTGYLPVYINFSWEIYKC